MSKGSILIYTSAAGQAAPLPGVTLTVTDAGGSVRARLVTDADGFAARGRSRPTSSRFRRTPFLPETAAAALCRRNCCPAAC